MCVYKNKYTCVENVRVILYNLKKLPPSPHKMVNSEDVQFLQAIGHNLKKEYKQLANHKVAKTGSRYKQQVMLRYYQLNAESKYD